jgi:hypothetical protein
MWSCDGVTEEEEPCYCVVDVTEKRKNRVTARLINSEKEEPSYCKVD